MTIMAVMGCGKQKGSMSDIKGLKVNINLIPKIQVNTIIVDEILDDVLLQIQEQISTNTVGDGKVFIYDLQDAMRIRTGERGNKVL